MEHFIATQTKTNELFGEQINQLNSKFDVMTSHQKATDTQIAQIAQQVSSLSRPQGQLSRQLEVNPKGHINTVYTRSDGLVDSPLIVLQEIAHVPVLTGPVTMQKGGNESLKGRSVQSPLSHPYQLPVPYP